MSDPSKVIQGVYELSLYQKDSEELDEKTIESIRKLLSLLLDQNEHNDLSGLINLMQTASLDIDYFQFGRFLFLAMRHYYKKWPELSGMNRIEKTWIQCSNCSRWRIVTSSESDKYSGNDEQWFCNLNRDLLFSDCRLSEEFPDSEVDPRSVFLFTRYFLTKEAIEFLVETGSALIPEKAEKTYKASVKRELNKKEISAKTAKRLKNTKLYLRSQLFPKSLENTVKPIINTPSCSSTSTTLNSVTKVVTNNSTTSPRKWKVQDEVSVLWMNGEYKEAIIVGAPNKGDAFLVRLVEDEDQMYTIKAERIVPRIQPNVNSASNNSSEFTLDEFHIYEANTPFIKTNSSNTPSSVTSSSTTTTTTSNTVPTSTTNINKDQESTKPVEKVPKPNNLSELSDVEEDNDSNDKWDYEEEGRLLIAIEKFGFNWEKVSDYVASKTTLECRDRWKVHARMLSEFVHQPISD